MINYVFIAFFHTAAVVSNFFVPINLLGMSAYVLWKFIKNGIDHYRYLFSALSDRKEVL